MARRDLFPIKLLKRMSSMPGFLVLRAVLVLRIPCQPLQVSLGVPAPIFIINPFWLIFLSAIATLLGQRSTKGGIGSEKGLVIGQEALRI